MAGSEAWLASTLPLDIDIAAPHNSSCFFLAGEMLARCNGARQTRRSVKKLRLRLPQLAHMNATWFAQQYGKVRVYAQGSSKTREDTTAVEDGGLPETRLPLSRFLQAAFLGGDLAKVRNLNYVKLVAFNEDKPKFNAIGKLATAALSEALRRRRVRHPPPHHTTWSLWLGAAASTTAMHIDYQSFNILYVVTGVKRLVLIDPAFHYPCTQRPRVRRWDIASCWSGVDVLSRRPPSHAKEVWLRAGDALVIPEHYWHAAENLEPTIAIGLNALPTEIPRGDDEEEEEGSRLR